MSAAREKIGDCTREAAGFCDVSIFLPADFALDSGERLSRLELKLRVHGDVEKPAVAVAGGISAGRIVADTPDDKGWWREIVCAGGAVDLDRFCVIGFDFLPNTGETARTISTADQARALAHGLDVLKIKKLHAFAGASYGGMVALSFAAQFPERIDNICVVSASDRAHPAATALRGVQRRIIEFATRAGHPGEGVSLARQLAMITYRTPEEFEARFESAPGEAAGDPYDVCEYLISRGAVYDVSAGRYLTLSDSIDRHRAEPSKIKAKTLFVAADSDRLVPLADIRRLCARIDGARLVEIPSLYGHDAFLKEAAVIGPHVKSFLEEPSK